MLCRSTRQCFAPFISAAFGVLYTPAMAWAYSATDKAAASGSNPYLYILLFMIAVAVVCSAFIIIPSFLATHRPSKSKIAPYECGIDVKDAEITQLDVRFYLIAMLFLVFDCEVVFLFPWTVMLKQVSAAGFASVMFFLFVLAVGLLYEWRKKSLDW